MNTPLSRPPRRLGVLQLVLLAVPCIAVLAVPIYNRAGPALWGIPFFYWWQMVWVPLSSVFIGLVYRQVVSHPGHEE